MALGDHYYDLIEDTDPSPSPYLDRPIQEKPTYYPLPRLAGRRLFLGFAPLQTEDIDERPLQKKKLGRFFVGGGAGVPIVDYTPIKAGTRRRLGSF